MEYGVENFLEKQNGIYNFLNFSKSEMSYSWVNTPCCLLIKWDIELEKCFEKWDGVISEENVSKDEMGI